MHSQHRRHVVGNHVYFVTFTHNKHQQVVSSTFVNTLSLSNVRQQRPCQIVCRLLLQVQLNLKRYTCWPLPPTGVGYTSVYTTPDNPMAVARLVLLLLVMVILLLLPSLGPACCKLLGRDLRCLRRRRQVGVQQQR